MSAMTSPGQAAPRDPAPARLFGVHGSAPSYSAELMLRAKAIPYRRVNVLAGLHRVTLRARGFPGGTVPAVKLGRRAVQTNRAIARALDETSPDPPLFPDDAGERRLVEEAERFGDEVLQDMTRRIVLWHAVRDPGCVRPDPRIGPLPIADFGIGRGPAARVAFAMYSISPRQIATDLRDLPPALDTLDGYVADGVLGSPQPTAADFQIAPLIAALLGIDGVGGEVSGRRCAALVERVLPPVPAES